MIGWCSRYVFIVCGGALTTFFDFRRRSYMHARTPSRHLDRRISTRLDTLPIDLRLHSASSTLPSSAASASSCAALPFRSISPWLDLDVCGASGFDSRLAGWFVGNPWSTFFVAALAPTVLDASRRLRRHRLDPSPHCALGLVWRLCGPVWTTFVAVRRVPRVF